MNYISAYCTDAGAIKRINQDSLCIKSAVSKGNEYIMAAVCDGLGGLSDGETASAYIICTLSDWFEKTLPVLLKEEKSLLQIRQKLDEDLHAASERINLYSAKTGKSMGTTLTCLLYLGNADKIIITHIGDTRAYLITDEGASVLTTDHSVISEEVKNGNISEEEAANDRRQNQLTRCIGAGIDDITFDYSIVPAEHGPVYMLCSDGFRKKLSSAEITAELSPENITDEDKAGKILLKLTKLCIKRDETDNISALVIKLKEKAENQIA